MRVSTAEMEGLMLRRLDNMKAARFAVSGTRKVACVVSTAKDHDTCSYNVGSLVLFNKHYTLFLVG